MNEFNRKTPEEILKTIHQEDFEINNTRGKLKIFLGFCAGVGKTYHMLEEAKSAVKNGINTVIGVVETHGRADTEALLEGLTIIPKKEIDYNSLKLHEMDIDKILELKPSLVIVDELAHTNIAGSRHEKRYQDVEELINAGIDVYTTLNIQHVESLIDIVQEISYVKIHETVPDRIFELSYEVELVDITPEKLIERLNEGKIYIPEKAQIAVNKFFRKGNLLALRELALRYTAQKVDEEMLSYKEKYSINTIWQVGSRLLVSFSSSPSSERLLRFTHKMASEMKADWHAVYVESPQQIEVNKKSEEQLNRNIKIAEELGAKVASLSGSNIADAIVDYAKQKNVTLIVAGLSRRSLFDEMLKGSVLNDLTKKSGAINVLIIGSDKFAVDKKPAEKKHDINFRPLFWGILSIALIMTFGMNINGWFNLTNIGMIMLLPVIVISIFSGTRAGLVTALIAVFAFDFFLIPPYYTLKISDLAYLPSFVVFIVISLMVSLLAKGIRWQTQSSKDKERFLSSLYAFTREIMGEKNLDELLKKASKQIEEAFECEVVVLLPDEKSKLYVAQKRDDSLFDDKEKAVAVWTFKNKMKAGKSTKTLSMSKWYYLPLMMEEKPLGVIGITKPDGEKFLSAAQHRLLESFANIIALCVQKQ